MSIAIGIDLAWPQIEVEQAVRRQSPARRHRRRAPPSLLGVGGVSEVEIPTERRSGTSRGLAYVTMTSPAYAAAALRELDGAPFSGKRLRVSASPIPTEKASPTVKVVQPFRERANMTYEPRLRRRAVDAPDLSNRWRALAHRGALGAVAREWNERAASSSVRPLDADGVMTAMRDVRAV